ncbi:MAG: hypothetical protein JEY91_14375, partial [Spirochaetaceae bacterium]|nr:hypothetical protein [Spirochaetaceae bacterium]
MNDNTDKLKNYIEEISLLQVEYPFNLLKLKNGLERYNLSEEEQDKIEVICESHKRRSDQLIKSGNIKGAINSMERAVAIQPLSIEFRNKLAQLYDISARKEGFKKGDRDLAYNTASFSLRLNKNNPIARSILKDIKKNDNRISGRDLNKKLIPPLLVLIMIVLVAVFTKNDFSIPFLSNKTEIAEPQWEKPPMKETIPFTERTLDTQISSTDSDFTIQIDKSLIAKVNGSFSYTIQGEISAPEKALTSADLTIHFINSSGTPLFRKTVSLVEDNEIFLPGEGILIDEFFYIHYLPPEIERISLNLTNVSFSDDYITGETPEEIYLQWDTARPEGVNIALLLKSSTSIYSYAGSYRNMK